jgi:hypothetical protein
MEIVTAQRDVRYLYRGGFFGQLVSAALWSVSAAFGTWGTPRQAILILVLGGFLIFPLTTLLVRAATGRASLGSGHPMNGLAMQIAFTLPLTLPLVGAATMYRLHWFYPAFMIALGAHYLPFTFLYGMRMFMGLGGVLIAGGLSLALWGPTTFSLGGWITGVVLALAAFAGLAAVSAEQARTSAGT